jgi:hypothetical protein
MLKQAMALLSANDFPAGPENHLPEKQMVLNLQTEALLEPHLYHLPK